MTTIPTTCLAAAPHCARADYLPALPRSARRTFGEGNGAITLDDVDASGAFVITLIGTDA